MKIENSSVSSFVDFYSEISAAIIQVEALKKKSLHLCLHPRVVDLVYDELRCPEISLEP